MKGYIHSFESFGTVDGPGVRYVVFFQGCPMRCGYCHNPDTWHMKDGTIYSTDEIIARFEKNRAFYKTGGITATGGEPLLQLDFLIELFQKAKEKNISTCLDTSGIIFDPTDVKKMEKFETLCNYTELVMLDIKHMDEAEHEKLTGQSNKNVFAFAEFLAEKKIPVWIRHVVVPGVTFVKEELEALGTYLKTLPNVEKIEVLPFHKMAVTKYEQLNISYPFKEVRALTKEEAKEAEQIIYSKYKN